MEQTTYQVTIKNIDAEGNGITHIDGKTVFINDVLPNEIVNIEIYKRRNNFDKARALEIITPSPERVAPQCPNFGICGGCTLQHIEFKTQVKYKQQVLIDNLKHLGKVTTQIILPPLYGKPWGYRHRARLSAKYVAKKGGTLVGFREKGAPYVVNMTECHILPPHISNLIVPLRQLLDQLSIKAKIPQIEVAVGDNISVILLRIMEPLNDNDRVQLKEFADKHNNNNSAYPVQIWLQPSGPESSYPFYPLESKILSYSLPEFNVTMPYYPTEFTQVNPGINMEMVHQAIKLLDPQAHEIIADFFCGIGNFTLPIAKSAKRVIGIEGNNQLVKRAHENAQYNKLADNTTYLVANLFKIDTEWLLNLGKMDKWLIDPPRDGAMELVKIITPKIAPQKIVYVSCNPATLARDAGILVHEHGYTLTHAGVMNMFPHTSHIESIAVFELS